MRKYRQVTEFEPKIADYLARHRDRLIDPEPPRGLWVCEEDGEPIMVLTAYIEPHLRISVIIDQPETKPFQSLARLAEAFEEWAKSVGVGRYGVVIHKGDDHYCRIIERRGGVMLHETPEWIEYVHDIDQTPKTEDAIRHWIPSDWKALRPLISASLRSDTGLGASFRATRSNVEALIRMGMRGAAKGDPCLLAYEAGAIVGFSLWFGFASPLEMRERVCSATGLHVHPSASEGLARRLQDAALQAAWTAGYTRVDGLLLNNDQLTEWKAAGASVGAVVARIARPIEERKVA